MLGETIPCLHVGAGSLLGLPAIVGNEPYSLTAIARKGSKVSVMNRRDFEDVVRSRPSLYPKVLQVLRHCPILITLNATVPIDAH